MIFKKNKMRIKQPFVVVGDSHVRAFSGNSNFFPIFLGPGKQFNFVDDRSAKKVQDKILGLKTVISNTNELILFLGEPDTRYYLKETWTPWESQDQECSKTLYFENLNKSFVRYTNVISNVSKKFVVSIMNITPSDRISQNAGVEYLNLKLKRWCGEKGILFIDINSRISNDGQLDTSYALDHVHCNTKIQQDVLSKLQEAGKAIVPACNSTLEENKIKEMFKYNERFGCFLFEDE